MNDERIERRDAPPDWIRGALRQTARELGEFVATGLAFSRHPGRFADEWYRGEREALNPFGMLATAAAIVASAHQFLPPIALALVKSARPTGDEDDSLARQLLAAVGPFAHYALLGALAHAVLRAGGSTRKLRGSLGVALFAGAGPGFGAYLLIYLAAMAVTLSGSGFFAGEYAFVAVAPGFLVFAWALGAGLAGLHDVPVWRAALAIAIAVVVSGVFFGLLPPWPEVFGLHLRLAIEHRSLSVRFTDQ